jgi:hypothetical protein
MLAFMASSGRIFFPGNPWPKGHPIKAAEWTAQLCVDGLRLHFHVKSYDYDHEDDRDDEELDDDWKARGAWGNYHACTLSSTFWGHRGILVAKPGKPFDLEKLEGKTLRADRVVGDKLPDAYERDELAFGLYLLGHDTACDHRIRFVKRRGPSTYDIEWRGRIALTYIGRSKPEYSFRLVLPKLRLGGIDVDKELDTKAAKALLPAVVAGSGRYRLSRRRFVRTAR